MKYKFSLTILFFCWMHNAYSETERNDMTELDMADLLKVQVTSVSKKAQALSDAPAAVFVIHNEDIKRSGVTSIPEALRMAPGIDVARINANKWAITSRGFNGSAANKLLVLIDGRSVYTPGFSGVYWDAQDVLLDDVERIEIVRGPGATLWGANAVNGVINIITKRAEETQDGLLTGGGGSVESGFGGLRYGKKLANDTYGRVYVKGFERDSFKKAHGSGHAGDQWEKQQGGFRIDSRLSNQDEVTLQGDIYRTNLNQAITVPLLTAPFQQKLNDDIFSRGWNITSRFRHTFSTSAEYTWQFYYDHTQRDEFTSQQSLDTLDIDFQNSFALNDWQQAIWGVGYRANLDKFVATPILAINPSSRNTQLFSAFVQDELTLVDNTLWLTIGSKFEHNDFSGFEGQPTGRLMWAPSPRHRIWTSLSRSVKTPSRANQDLYLLSTVVPSPPIEPLGGQSLPVLVNLIGNKNFQSEVQISYELGYRLTLSQNASLDFTGFYNDYDKLQSTLQGDPEFSLASSNPVIHQPIYFQNSGKAHTYGFEAATIWQMTDWWRWDTNYSFLKTVIHDFQNNPNAISPKHKISLRAVINPIDSVNFDLWLRYNSTATALTPVIELATPTRKIEAYLTLDARLSWKVLPSLEISLVGQNLLEDHHLEYIDEGSARLTSIPRSVYGKIALEF